MSMKQKITTAFPVLLCIIFCIMLPVSLSARGDIPVSSEIYSPDASGIYSDFTKALSIGQSSGLENEPNGPERSALQRIPAIPLLYGVCALVSALLLVYYCIFNKEKRLWMLLMLISVFIVNMGYTALSLADDVSEAMRANRIAYFGNAFLPFLLLIIISNICRFRCKTYIVWILGIFSMLMFLFAVSAGYTTLFYKSVSYEMINGIVVLSKEYGSHHLIYTAYVILYYLLAIGVVLFSIRRKKLVFAKYIAAILIIVFMNIVIWGIEHLFNSNFEFLSISYIFTEVMLLLIYSAMAEYGLLDSFQAVLNPEKTDLPEETNAQLLFEPSDKASSRLSEETLETICSCLSESKQLSKREIEVLVLLLRGNKRRDIAESLFITENTVKTHTAHIYSKLNVSGREELQDKLCEMTENKSH